MTLGRILIVEDDQNISKLVKYNLEKAGFICEVAVTGEDALEVLRKRPFDLLVLDIMLPKMDGLETCRIIKGDKAYKDIPVVMMTAKGEEIDRIVGFELGADDYIIKPFSPRELVLRIKAILKRKKTPEPGARVLTIDPITVDVPRHKVSVNHKEVQLTAMEFKLLATLLERQGRVQTRDQLLEDVWNLDAEVTTRTIDTHVKRLRQKLGRWGKVIETVRGIGYKIDEPSDDD